MKKTIAALALSLASISSVANAAPVQVNNNCTYYAKDQRWTSGADDPRNINLPYTTYQLGSHSHANEVATKTVHVTLYSTTQSLQHRQQYVKIYYTPNLFDQSRGIITLDLSEKVTVTVPVEGLSVNQRNMLGALQKFIINNSLSNNFGVVDYDRITRSLNHNSTTSVFSRSRHYGVNELLARPYDWFARPVIRHFIPNSSEEALCGANKHLNIWEQGMGEYRHAAFDWCRNYASNDAQLETCTMHFASSYSDGLIVTNTGWSVWRMINRAFTLLHNA